MNEDIISNNQGNAENLKPSLQTVFTSSSLAPPFKKTISHKKAKTEAELTPLYLHAQKTAKLSPLQEKLANERKKSLFETKTKFIKTIYGNRKNLSPSARNKFVSQHTNEIYQYFAGGTIDLGRIIKDRERQSQTMQKSMSSVGELTFASACRSYIHAKPHPVDRLIEECDEIHRKTEYDSMGVDKDKKQIIMKLQKIKQSLLKDNKGDTKISNKKQKEFMDNKKLFIYGKKGQGRFLSVEAKDMVRISDLIMKMNPKYPFLHSRLNDILGKPRRLSKPK